MIKTKTKSVFPSQAVPDEEKSSFDYGLQVAKAVESEWFNRDGGSSRYYDTKNRFHELRLYARGEQSVQKYKDELSINGDLSYLNLDWKPVPIIPKFVDIVVNGISERLFKIKAFSQDPASVKERTDYVEAIMEDMQFKTFKETVQQETGVNTFNNDPANIPEDEDELSIHMQLDYKQGVEIAEEEALDNLFNLNKYSLVKKRLDYDLTVLGIACVKNGFNTAEGVTIEYVDPANIVYSYSESPFFDDLYYVGEVRRITITQLKKQFPELTQEQIEDLESKYQSSNYDRYNYYPEHRQDKDYINVLYFEYKTFNNQVYKIKQTASGADKAIEKSDTFNPPKDQRARFQRVQRSIEVLYSGVKVLGHDILLDWKLCENMTRPKSDITKVSMSYNIVAPRMYKGIAESLVSRMMTFADMIQLTHLKLQQVMSRMVPDGVYLDADGIAEIDLGNGTNYNPQEALNMFFQTGSVIGRSFTSEGDMNPGKVPIQEITSGSGGNKIQALIANYNYYLQMIRDTTGLNEARDGSTPDKNALVGIQKIAAANSNTATRHILQAGLFLTAEVAESLSLRISDIIEYSPTRDAFIQAIGAHNVATLEEMSELHLYDFGIFIELEPDEEEKQLLENNIQAALAQQSIELEDAIDLRMIKNVKLANQLLKIRRKKKQERDQELNQRNIQAQAQANAQAQEVAAQAEIKKQEAITQMQTQLEQVKAQINSEKLVQEAKLKKELMAYEFQLNMRIKNMENSIADKKETQKEDRKDQRVKLQGEEQRKSKNAAKSFESSGNDTLGQGIDMSVFNPR